MKNPYQTVLGASSFVIFAWIIWLSQPDFPLDDAYIVQHTVNGLYKGYEDRFINSSPTQGITSPAHVLLISIFAFFMPSEWAQIIVISVSLILYLLSIFHFSQINNTPISWSYTLVALSAIAGLNFNHLVNGLETGLAMTSIIWVLALFYSPIPKKFWHYSILGALPFIRPELGALSGVIFIRSLLLLKRQKDQNRQFFYIIIYILMGMLPFIIFLKLLGESLFPNTMSAKIYFFSEGCLPVNQKIRFLTDAIEFFIKNLGFSSVGFLGILFLRIRYIVIFIIIFLIAYYLRLPGALFHNWYRYLYILAPLAIIGWCGFICSPKSRISIPGKIMLFLAIITSFLSIPDNFEIYSRGINFSRTELAGAAKWIDKNLSDQSILLVHDAGYISLKGNQPLVDLVGLKTSQSISIHRNFTWQKCGRDPRAIDQIAHFSKAQYVVLLDDWDHIFRLKESLRITGWDVARVDIDRGNTKYKIYKITR